MRDFTGYRQLSRKYRHVGKLPEGKTGLQCLREADPALAAHFERNLEEMCADWYLRIYAREGDGCVEALSVEEFEEFLHWKKNRRA